MNNILPFIGHYWYLILLVFLIVIFLIFFSIRDKKSETNFKNLKKEHIVSKPIFVITFKDLRNLLKTQTIRSILVENFNSDSESEKQSWNNNEYFINILQKARINNDCIIVFEWIKKDNTRIDITLFGVDSKGKQRVMLFELKAWSNDSTKIKYLMNRYGHPNKQSSKYFFMIKKQLEEKNITNVNLQSIVYMYNYNKNFSPDSDYLLFKNDYFSKNDKYLIDNFLYTLDDNERLISKLSYCFANGMSWESYNNIIGQ